MCKAAALLLAVIAGLAAPARAADPPAETPEQTPAGRLFGARCTSCHTIGQGPKIGPDLLGVTDRRKPEWIRTFLTSPGAAIDKGDATALELFNKFNKVRMPEQNLAAQEIDGLIAFFTACTAKKGCQPIGAPRLAIDATQQEIDAGRELFNGARRFSKGGPPCAQCHHVRGAGALGGGTLGGELTYAWARLHDKALEERILATPLEQRAYAGRMPTDEEKWQVRGYLAFLSRDGTREPAGGDFFELGLMSAIASLGLVGITWLSRHRGKR